MHQMKWHFGSTLLLLLVLISNLRNDITAESILGLEGTEKSQNFETCERKDDERLNENTLKDKQLFLSEGGW